MTKKELNKIISETVKSSLNEISKDVKEGIADGKPHYIKLLSDKEIILKNLNRMISDYQENLNQLYAAIRLIKVSMRNLPPELNAYEEMLDKYNSLRRNLTKTINDFK